MPGAEDFLTVNILKIRVQLRSESVRDKMNGGLGKNMIFKYHSLINKKRKNKRINPSRMHTSLHET